MTTRVPQDGERVRFGTESEFCEFFYDLSANIMRVQGPTSATSNTPRDLVDFAIAGAIFNEAGLDYDWRFEGDTNANVIVLDAGLNALSFGGANVAGTAHAFNNLSTRAAVTSVGHQMHVPAQTTNFSNASETLAIGPALFLGIPTYTGDTATLTFTDAVTLYIAGAPVASTNVAITNTALSLWVDAGSSRFDGNVTMNLTLTAGADGVGTSGEQLTSGGAGAETSWTAAASLREFKNLLGVREDTAAALRLVCGLPVWDFRYKTPTEHGGRVMGTGDYDTVYTGVMAEDAPWLMHHHGSILNPVNTVGYLVLAIKGLAEKVERLEDCNAKAWL